MLPVRRVATFPLIRIISTFCTPLSFAVECLFLADILPNANFPYEHARIALGPLLGTPKIGNLGAVVKVPRRGYRMLKRPTLKPWNFAPKVGEPLPIWQLFPLGVTKSGLLQSERRLAFSPRVRLSFRPAIKKPALALPFYLPIRTG